MASKHTGISGRADEEESAVPSRGVSYLPVRPSRHTDLLEYIKSIKDSNDYHELELISRGRHFQVHKLVLAGQSRYFREALSSNKTVPTLTLDFDADVLSICLDYLYNGTVQVDTRYAAPLGSLSDQLGIDNLTHDCRHYQMSSHDLSTDNCISQWEVACALGDTDLIQKARPLMLDNFDSLSTSPDFLKLPLGCVKILLSHPDLGVSSPDDRLTSALDWVQEKPHSRSNHLISLLNVLPLHKISKKFLKYTQRVDPILKSHPQASKLLGDVVAGVRQTEHCALILGARKDTLDGVQLVTQDVYAVTTSLASPVRTVTRLPAPLHQDSRVACCMDGSTLITSGLGDGRNGVMKHDFLEGGWRECAPLNTARVNHCMCVHKGDVYVLGGGYNPGFMTLEKSVEVMISGSNHWQQAGNLVGSLCYNTVCCLLGEEDILVFGVEDEQKRSTLQVYSTVSQTVTHTLSLPDGRLWLYGVVVAGEHVIMMAQNNTYVCPVSSIYKGVSIEIQKRLSYKTPNWMCAVALTDDLSHVVLVGGGPRDMTSPHFIYRAPVRDIVQGTGVGWERLKTSWPVGMCHITGGAVCTGLLPASLIQ